MSSADAALLPARREADRVRLFGEILRKLNGGAPLEDIFELISRRLREFVPCNRLSVGLLNEKEDVLTIVAARSDGRMSLTRGYRGPIAGSGLAGLLKGGGARILGDLEDRLRCRPSCEPTRLIVKEGMRSNIALPLLARGRPVGVMFVSSRRRDSYRPEHEEILRQIAGCLSIAVERSRITDQLRDRTAYLQNILRNSAEAIIVLSRDHIVLDWNGGARRIFGYSETEIVGRPCTPLLPPELRESDELQRIQEAVERDGFLNDYETERLTKDGRRLTVNLTAAVLRDGKGRILGRSSILRDITHVRKLQSDLVKSQSLAAVGELAATVAHEIKNPLAGISGAIQVLADSIPAGDPRRDVVGEILDQIRRLDSTVRDLLVFARPATPQRKEVGVGETLVRAWSLLAQQPEAAAVRFSVAGADRARLRADPHLLEQVWFNLFQNAIEAMPGGGEIDVRVSDGPTVRIAVRDTGAGMNAESMGKLFRPFFSTKTRGTGLGLAITRKIVEAHGGTIRIESRPNHGTLVVVEMPR